MVRKGNLTILKASKTSEISATGEAMPTTRTFVNAIERVREGQDMKLTMKNIKGER